MSRSDPLLKRFKALILEFRTKGTPVLDDHPQLQPFCETLELILRKGLKDTTTIFGRQKRDYWSWIEMIPDIAENRQHTRVNPIFAMVVSDVQKCRKVTSLQGRGRQFIRVALHKKVLGVPVDFINKNDNLDLLLQHYDPGMSIVGDEILCEIFLSLLFEATEIDFKLRTTNSSFVDMTWTIPVYRTFEFVPCTDLGVQVYISEGRAIADKITPNSVAAERKGVEVGDVLDELCGEPLKGLRRGKISAILKHNQGFPVYLSVVKCHLWDGSVFHPIGELLKKQGKDVRARKPQAAALPDSPGKPPPHALLPEDEADELPVSNSNEGAVYKVQYVGRIAIGQDGGVHMIEVGINKVLEALKDKPHLLKDIVFELGEKDVIISDRKTNKEMMRHSYTEISSCGRRVDNIEYFAYIAGETTCTLAKQFVAHIYKSKCDEEAKTILCSIAQGFNRTHWFV